MSKVNIIERVLKDREESPNVGLVSQKAEKVNGIIQEI